MTKKRIIAGATVALLTAVSAANAQQQPAPNFCENNPGFDQWDFWVGDWDVSAMSGGPVQGTNTITKMANGCMLFEDWTANGGGKGYSINYYNPITDKWRQVWVANGYNIDYEGGLVDGSIVLEGHLFNYATGAVSGFRGTFTPLEGGDVRQFFEIQNMEDMTWSTWFDGRYVRQQKMD